MKRIVFLSLTMLALVALFNNCKGPEGRWQGPQNGTGYSGFRPEAGVYSARVTCSSGGEAFENLTVKNDSDTALIENECTQQSSEIQLTDLSYQAYRKDHLGHKDQIYEKNMPRDPDYYNEALCDFSDNQFAILVRFYDINVYHVGHIFSLEGNSALPVVRFSDATFDDGHYGTAYMGENFQLAVINSFPVGEGFVGMFSGKVNSKDIVDSVGICITTIYTCNPLQLTVNSTGTPGQFSISSAEDPNLSVSGSMTPSTEIPDIHALDLDVEVGGKIYDCTGYVSNIVGELSIGGCLDRPTDGSEPKRSMVQIRGKINWQTPESGTINSKICTGELLKDP